MAKNSKTKKKVSTVRHFLRNRDGASAVEFAIVAPVFLGLMFSVMEFGWVAFSNGVMERAKKDATRFIRTGQIHSISTENDPDAQRNKIFEQVCSYAKIFGDCTQTLTVEVITFDSFADMAENTSPPVCRDAAEDLRDQIKFDPGTDDSIVRVRICVLYDTLNPAIGLSLKQQSGAKDRIISQHIFRNEPFTRNIR